MGAKWQKNEISADARGCLVIVTDNSGIPAEPGIDFIALGSVFIVGANAPDADLALGTMENIRRALVIDDLTFTADHGTDTFEAVGHDMKTGDGPVRLTNAGGALPAGVSTGTDYWIIEGADADHFQLAESLADAYAETEVTISDNGTGTHTLVDTASTQRGMWGHFWYTATQGETNHDSPEMVVMVDDADHLMASGAGARTSVEMSSDGDAWEAMGADGVTRGEEMTRVYRGEVAPYTYNPITGHHMVRNVADTADSHEGVITASGRIDTDQHPV